MDQLPGNSHRQQTAAETPKKNIVKVVTGEVTTRKQPWYRRLKENLLAGRVDSVGDFILWQVLIPRAKDAMADASKTAIDQMVYGTTRLPTGQTIGSQIVQSVGQYGNKTNYAGISKPGGPMLPTQHNALTPGARANFDFRELVIPTRPEAEMVLGSLAAAIAEYNAVTVADLYQMCGITGNYTDDRYGWTDISTAGIVPIGGGYVLDLPRPITLD